MNHNSSTTSIIFKSVALVYFLVCHFSVDSQTSTGQIGSADNKGNFFNPNFFVKARAYPTKLEGSPMLFKENKPGYLVPKRSGKTKEFEINYNLLTLQTVVQINDIDYSLNQEFLDSLVVFDEGNQHVFLYKKLTDKGSPVLLEVLVNGSYPLLKNIEATLIAPNYNAALMSGSRNHTIEKVAKFYTTSNGKLLELPKKWRTIKKKNGFDKELEKAAKDLKPNCKKEKVLIEFFNDLNHS